MESRDAGVSKPVFFMNFQQSFSTRHRQQGISFIGVLFAGAMAACVFILGARVVPTVIEYQAIMKAVDKASAGNTVPEVRAIFDKAGQIDDIRSISGKDLDVTKESDKTVVSFAYSREIHIAGPAYLLLKYNGRSR